MMPDVVACILAGGEGRRLLPLTTYPAKPALRFGGTYRLIDFPLSNCVNSGMRKILVLSQYRWLSLERHMRHGWSFLSAQPEGCLTSLRPQRRASRIRYQGTADAVYQNLASLERLAPAHVLILASDHVYHMDYRNLLQFHREHGADVTVASFPVPRHQAREFGIVTVDGSAEVTSFLEKPQDLPALPSGTSTVLASMGIYLFTFDVLRAGLLEDSLRRSTHDFGRDLLPNMVRRYRVEAYPFLEGIHGKPAYWRDVGTIDSYWEAHMDLVGRHPRFQLEHPQWPLHSAGSPDPWSISPEPKRSGAEDCTIHDGRVERSILSPGVYVDADAEVEESILLDGVHMGRGAKVRRAILDQGTTVPPGARIGYESANDGERCLLSEAGIAVLAPAPTPRSPQEGATAFSRDRSPEGSAEINALDEPMRSLLWRSEIAQHVA